MEEPLKPSCSHEKNNNAIDTSTQSIMNAHLQQRLKNSPLLDGTFFKVAGEIRNFKNFEVTCVTCQPKIKILKANLDATSNLLKHLKQSHRNKFDTYIKHKSEKKNPLSAKLKVLYGRNKNVKNYSNPLSLSPTFNKLSLTED